MTAQRRADPTLDELARKYGLPPSSAGQLEDLVEYLEASPWAPTALTDHQAIMRSHIADSLVALEVEELVEARAVADVGSGAGFPGLVLAVARPDALVDLVEASSRKAAYAGSLAARAGVGNVRVVDQRAETWAAGPGREQYDAVVSRAVGTLATVCEYAAPLLRVGGCLVVWKGRRDPGEEQAGIRAAEVLGMEPLAILAVGPYAGSRHRHLHVYRKARATPERFPRRPGMARKRPIE